MPNNRKFSKEELEQMSIDQLREIDGKIGRGTSSTSCTCCDGTPAMSFCDMSTVSWSECYSSFCDTLVPSCECCDGTPATLMCPDEMEFWGGCYSIENTFEINLWNSDLTGEIPPEIGNLVNLTRLVLGANSLTGEIPVEIGNLTSLTELNLRDNQLTGEIPVEIGNLINLEELWLDNNQLTSLPESIGNLSSLERLWLKDNQLTTLPDSICNLPLPGNINNINVSYNQLCYDYHYDCIEESCTEYPYECWWPQYPQEDCPPYPECQSDLSDCYEGVCVGNPSEFAGIPTPYYCDGETKFYCSVISDCPGYIGGRAVERPTSIKGRTPKPTRRMQKGGIPKSKPSHKIKEGKHPLMNKDGKWKTKGRSSNK